MINQQIKVVAFDVFGTLIKINHRRSPYKKLMKWLKDSGRKPLPTDAATIMSINGSFEEIADFFGTKIPSDLLDEMYADLDFELQHIEPYEDAVETINQLKSTGYKVVLCSNTAKPYGKKVSFLLPLCDAYSWSYEQGFNKPDPRIYQYFIDLLNCKPEEVLFVGDTQLADFKGQLAVGMHARLIDRKNGQDLSKVIYYNN